MKKFLLIVFVIILSESVVYSQKAPATSKVIYRIWVDTGKVVKKAYLARISDSVIYVSATPVYFNPEIADTNAFKPVNYNLLKKVRLVKTGGWASGFLIGALGGATAGAVTGIASGDDVNNCFICFTASEKALIDGVFLGAVGGVVGAIIGLKEKKYRINGQKSNFDQMRRYLESQVKLRN